MQKDTRIEISRYLIPALSILIIILASFFFWGKDRPRIENRNSNTPSNEIYDEDPLVPSPCYQLQEDGVVEEVQCKG